MDQEISIRWSDLQMYSSSNCKAVVRNIPVSEAEFRILIQRFSEKIKWLKFYSNNKQGIIKKDKLSKCFLQLDPSVINEFINEMNSTFFDAKGEKFTLEAELASFQSVPIATASQNTEFFTSPQFLQFKELYESGNLEQGTFKSEENLPPKKSSLVEMVKSELEEERKKKENKIKKKGNKWNKKNKNWKNKK
ncbi:unnamed protein product [Blepharisma stoltei]|uniref:UPF3 domain-containing protein n=1 Tax=Blepharisma stoltei TaxID=1481888 RepID=A0AAU9JTR9_9CILI|nr:unnamed protein product [Blepharisma stoltei]